MRFTRFYFIAIFSTFYLFASAQPLLLTGKESSGGHFTAECSSCKDFELSFYTTAPLVQHTYQGLQINLELDQGTVNITKDIESFVIPQFGNECQIYKHSFEVNLCCDCLDQGHCPEALNISLTSWEECLYDHLGIEYFDISCFNSENFDDYVQELELGRSNCQTSFDNFGICCEDGTTSGSESSTRQKIFERKNNDFTISPNPANSILNVRNIEEKDKLYISDLSGKMVKSFQVYTSKDQEINIGELKDGVYIIRKINKEGNVQMLKFVKK